jgi:hypothetical protein
MACKKSELVSRPLIPLALHVLQVTATLLPSRPTLIGQLIDTLEFGPEEEPAPAIDPEVVES